MIGIYKITSLTGRVYIGQSINIENRKQAYNVSNSQLKKQPKIYNSIIKYGWENHTHEVIEECSIEQLNEREIYWKQYYIDLNKGNWDNVLFCEIYDNGGGPKSKETKKKISISLQGKYKTEAHKNNISNGKSNISDETLLKMSKSLKGKKLGKKSTGSGRKAGFKLSEEHKEKLRQAKIGKPSNHKYK